MCDAALQRMQQRIADKGWEPDFAAITEQAKRIVKSKERFQM
jgi:hypothetical protein